MFEDFFDAQFSNVPVMGVFRSQGVTRTVALCEAAWDLGIDVVEVTIGHVDDIPSLYAAVAAGRDRGRSVGAGTVITPEQVHAAHSAGAMFTVSPGLDAAVIEESIKMSLPHLPGVSTPSEVQVALRLRLTWLKAFPIAWLGPSWVQHIRGPFPETRFVGTGGVSAHVAADYLAAGVDVVGMGSGFDVPETAATIRALWS